MSLTHAPKTKKPVAPSSPTTTSSTIQTDASNSDLNSLIPRFDLKNQEESWLYDAVKREQLAGMCTANETPGVAPVATGFTEVVMCDANIDSEGKAFGAQAIVVGPDGTVVNVVDHANTVPNSSTKSATVPEGSHPYVMGHHTFPTSKKTIAAQNLGSFQDDGTFERKIPLNEKNPKTGKGYIENANVHHGGKEAVSEESRWSEGCLTFQNDGSWEEYWNSLLDAQLDPQNLDPTAGFVTVHRGR